MNIADRILNLRKMKGISQEELADKIGVSRQAVSKWESEQSIPDLEKIIIMSDYFGVTTDYILKGIESSEQEEEKADARIFTIVATVFNFMGVIVSAGVWYEEQNTTAIMCGLIFMAMACMIFGIGMVASSEQSKKKAKQYFWSINIWLMLFLPWSFVYNVLGSGVPAPYPLQATPIGVYLAFWVVYVGTCLAVDFWMIRKR